MRAKRSRHWTVSLDDHCARRASPKIDTPRLPIFETPIFGSLARSQTRARMVTMVVMETMIVKLTE
jgi:hypothetical protein